MSRANGTTNGAQEQPNKAAEIGWLFVPQFYTTMNQNPTQLHRFYTKRSTMVHAGENEDVAPSFGQQDIHTRFQDLAFVDTKVYVSNVDSQASADGGIIIQVLGEMSNKGNAWRKFAQTFFLAQQPNGFYVLNDIFRYLKDEPSEEAEHEHVLQSLPSEPKPAEEEPKEPEPVSFTPVAMPAEPVPVPVMAAPVAAPMEPAAPAAPKTWANLAASNATKWGSAAPPTPAVSQPSTAPPKPARPASGQRSAHVFIKNVTGSAAANDTLKQALESQFGPVKDVQVNIGKNFAFAEFASHDAAQRAITQSTGGGIKVGDATVQIEQRRVNERSGGGNNRSRGGNRGGNRGGSHVA